MAKNKMKGASLEQAMPTPPKPDAHDYETHGHLRTLTDAFDIMSDKKKMAKVHALAGRHHKAISSLKDLRDARDSVFKESKGTGDTDNDND